MTAQHHNSFSLLLSDASLSPSFLHGSHGGDTIPPAHCQLPKVPFGCLLLAPKKKGRSFPSSLEMYRNSHPTNPSKAKSTTFLFQVPSTTKSPLLFLQQEQRCSFPGAGCSVGHRFALEETFPSALPRAQWFARASATTYAAAGFILLGVRSQSPLASLRRVPPTCPEPPLSNSYVSCLHGLLPASHQHSHPSTPPPSSLNKQLKA